MKRRKEGGTDERKGEREYTELDPLVLGESQALSHLSCEEGCALLLTGKVARSNGLFLYA